LDTQKERQEKEGKEMIAPRGTRPIPRQPRGGGKRRGTFSQDLIPARAKFSRGGVSYTRVTEMKLRINS